MSENVHGHQKPAKWGVNPDNPVFQRNAPVAEPAEIPQGLHGAPQLRSESEPPASTLAPQLTTEEAIEVASVPEPAQDSAIEAAEENAHNAAVAAEEAEHKADDAQANAEAVENS